jgi:hypothetical protein
MATRAPASANRVEVGEKHLEWVPISEMRISPRAQRKHDSPSSRTKIEFIATHFDPDKAGTLTVNLRDGIYWIIDGGHRYHALLLMGWEDQHVQCWIYRGLAEAQEADKFLSLNDVKTVSGMDKFQKALVAKYPVQLDIDRVVRAADLTVGTGRDAIGCVAAITKTYGYGPKVLATTVRIIRDAFGQAGFTAKATEGIGLFVANYENIFDEDFLIARLAAKKGGVNGLLGEAQKMKQRYGVSLAVGVAAAAVETYNQGRGRQKLNGWWSTFNGGTDPK